MKYVIVVLSILLSVDCFGADLQKVSVYEGEKLISELKSEDELSKFKKHWEQKQDVLLRARPQWTHIIEITSGGSWWYTSKQGIVMEIDSLHTTFYSIDDVSEFNKVLKISK